MAMEQPRQVACCLVTADGRVWDAHGSFGMHLDRELTRVLELDQETQASIKLTVLAPCAAQFGRARNVCSSMLVMELPAGAGDGRPSSSDHVELGSFLSYRDRASLLLASASANVLHVVFDAAPSPGNEMGYLRLLDELAQKAASATALPRPDRTGTGTYSVFGRQLRFDISHGIPLLTTKKLAWQKVLEELLWFARGETDVRDLQRRGVRIWDGNSSRAFLDSVGLAGNAEGDIGPAYGFQWRHFGADYRGAKSGSAEKYDGEGVDQLREVERQLREEPQSRRIILSAWNAAALESMALPPCHIMAQFYVTEPDLAAGAGRDARRKLSCHMYQRSVDTFLGFPWNIASYAMLTHILAARAGMEPDELVISTGDTHLYANHVQAALAQLDRTPRMQPRFLVSDEVAHKAWHEISIDDFAVAGYYPHPFIAAKMAV